MGAFTISQTGGIVSSISVKEIGGINELFSAYNSSTGEISFNSINDGNSHDYLVTFVGSQSGQVISRIVSLTCS
jgi:hypothetical protein